MIAVVQRVLSASVVAGVETIGCVGKGLVVMVAVQKRDVAADVNWLCNKIAGLRVFEDADGKMNLSCSEVNGGLLVVSNFTVAGNVQRGRRPSFDQAASFEDGRRLYESFVNSLRDTGLRVETGSYGEEMQVTIVNDGPITLIVESPE